MIVDAEALPALGEIHADLLVCSRRTNLAANTAATQMDADGFSSFRHYLGKTLGWLFESFSAIHKLLPEFEDSVMKGPRGNLTPEEAFATVSDHLGAARIAVESAASRIERIPSSPLRSQLLEYVRFARASIDDGTQFLQSE